MLAKERHDYILSELKKHQIVKAKDLVDDLGITIETARRDLNILQKKGELVRVYGGAVLPNPTARESFVEKRKLTEIAEKEAIGKSASNYVKENDIIFLGSGSTVLELAKNIKAIPGITVLTNSILILSELADTEINLILCGGQLNHREMNFTDQFAFDVIKNCFVDTTFIGAAGVTIEKGISDYNVKDANFTKRIMEQSNQTVLMADSKKFGHNALAISNPIESVSTIVTDDKLSKNTEKELLKLGIDLCIANLN